MLIPLLVIFVAETIMLTAHEAWEKSDDEVNLAFWPTLMLHGAAALIALYQMS